MDSHCISLENDSQPDNIMIVPNPDVPGGEQVKILDFGIAEVGAFFSDGRLASSRIWGRSAEHSLSVLPQRK